MMLPVLVLVLVLVLVAGASAGAGAGAGARARADAIAYGHSTLFYAESNEIKVATSVAYGADAQYNTDQVFM